MNPDKYDREKGIKAIIALQKMAGITETYKTASMGWDNMRLFDKDQTIWAYHFFIEGKVEKEV